MLRSSSIIKSQLVSFRQYWKTRISGSWLPNSFITFRSKSLSVTDFKRSNPHNLNPLRNLLHY